MRIFSNAFKDIFILRSFVGVLWFGFSLIYGNEINPTAWFSQIGPCKIHAWQIAPCWDQINKIIWVAYVVQRLLEIVSLMPISTVQDLPLHHYSLLEIGMWVISIHIYLICIFVVKGSRPSKDSKVIGKRDKWDFPLHLEWGYISARSKMTKWILKCIFPVMEWSDDTKNGYDDLKIYMEYGYVFANSTGRNHAKMATLSFKWIPLSIHCNRVTNICMAIIGADIGLSPVWII